MMDGFGGFQGSLAQDMSLLYSPSFKYQDTEFRKNPEMMDFNSYNYIQQNSGLARYRSAPSSFIECLVNGASDGDGAIGTSDYQYIRSSSPEMDTMLTKFMSPSNVSGNSSSHGFQDFVKKEVADSEMVYQSLPPHNLANVSVSVGNSLDRTFSVMDSMPLENSIQATKMNPVNRFNLVRQNSSPPGLFSNLTVDNGFGVMRDVGGLRACKGTNGEAGPSNSRLNNHANFSSGPSGLPQISEGGDESIYASSPDTDTDTNKRRHMTSFTNGAWDETPMNSFKRARDNDGNVFTGLNMLEEQSGNLGNRSNGLTHHLSLPKTAAEMATVEKFLQFQTSVPCKIRAKRGFATHPRSIAERVRRTRISERMRKLQDLFPNMDKQTNTADMLEMAVEHIKDLQKQVKTLTDSKGMCTCPSKQRQYSNCSA